MRILVAIANTLKMAGFEYKFAQIIPSFEKVFWSIEKHGASFSYVHTFVLGYLF